MMHSRETTRSTSMEVAVLEHFLKPKNLGAIYIDIPYSQGLWVKSMRTRFPVQDHFTSKFMYGLAL